MSEPLMDEVRRDVLEETGAAQQIRAALTKLVNVLDRASIDGGRK